MFNDNNDVSFLCSSSSIIDTTTTVLHSAIFSHLQAGRSVKGDGVQFITDDERASWLGGRRQRFQ